MPKVRRLYHLCKHVIADQIKGLCS